MSPRVIFTTVLVLAGCPGPAPVSPPRELDAGKVFGADSPEPEADSPCSQACETLRRVGCPEGAPSSQGETCAAVCRRAILDGYHLPATCIAAADSKEAVRACGRVRCQ